MIARLGGLEESRTPYAPERIWRRIAEGGVQGFETVARRHEQGA